MATHQEVEWTLGSTRVYGTLTRPDGPGPFAAVVMVAGSGPTDRDWNSPLLPGTNGGGRLLAEALADAGYASLRYDKRAAGPHAPDNLRELIGAISMASHREEYAGAITRLASEPDMRPDAIFGLGHSEGTLHVMHYQLQDPPVPLAGMILAAPPGRAVGTVVRWQLAGQAAAIPNGDALLALYDEAVARFLQGQAAEPDPHLPEGVRQLIAALETPANLPFARELWNEEATRLLAQIQVPVLIVIGKKDRQVDWELDGSRLEAAARDVPDVTVAYPEHANHGLKYEPQDRSQLNPAEVAAGYNAEDAILDPQTVSMMLDWLGNHVYGHPRN